MYLFNLNSASSPAEIPNGPYPNNDNPTGRHLVPVMYKF